MQKQINATPSPRTISDLYQKYTSGGLELRPAFQRKLVWNKKHSADFIQTILSGYPFPEIFLAVFETDIDKIETKEFVVDGQQRLTSIFNYINCENHNGLFGKDVRSWSDLSENEKRDFLGYEVAIRKFVHEDLSTIKQVFKRINLTQYNLNKVEIENAIYDGKFIITAKNILENIDLESFQIFSDSNLARMADLYFILLIMATIMHDGYFMRDQEIENYIITNNDSFSQSTMIKKKIILIFNIIKSLKLDKNSIWFRKSNFFTLFIELYKADGKLPIVKILRDSLEKFENKILSNKNLEKESNDFAEYYSHMFTGTNSRQARVVRGELFKKYIL